MVPSAPANPALIKRRLQAIIRLIAAQMRDKASLLMHPIIGKIEDVALKQVTALSDQEVTSYLMSFARTLQDVQRADLTDDQFYDALLDRFEGGQDSTQTV